MNPSKPIIVVDKDGLSGRIEPGFQPSEDNPSRLTVELDNGQKVWVPADLLTPREDGSYYLPLSLSRLDTQTTARTENPDSITIPVIEEEINIGRRQVKSGIVQITKSVQEHETLIDEPGFRDHVHVERVPINKVLDRPADVRYEGETMIIPVMEEELVIEKRLVLKEEVRITKLHEETRNPQSVTLRREDVKVERIEDNRAQEE